MKLLYKLVLLYIFFCEIFSSVNSGFVCVNNSTTVKHKPVSQNNVVAPSSGEYDIRPNLFIDRSTLIGRVGKEHKKEFTYGNGPFGPSHWAKIYPKCAGKHQSPINIDIPSLKAITLPELKWNEYYEGLPVKMTLTNTHNTLVLELQFKGDKMPTISGGPLQKPYAMKSLHFHWSSSDHKGSEHTVNKKSFPMEMHVVHYRTDLNYTTAVSQDKGLCVVGYIFEITGDKCNDAISALLSVADQATLEKDTPVDLENLFRLDSLVDTIDTDYVTYLGSLTTPPCYESVIWIVSPYTITLAKKQIEKFRAISGAAGSFGDNFRVVQPINDRIISFVKSKM